MIDKVIVFIEKACIDVVFTDGEKSTVTSIPYEVETVARNLPKLT